MSCSWPYIACFIKHINDNHSAHPITFLQVDQEWCNCGDFDKNITCVKSIIPNVKFTLATALGTPAIDSGISVPEVYWDAGNQFPCTGGPGTYQYLTPACTNWGIHRKLANQPKAFYDLIAGDDSYFGSDDTPQGKKQNAWLGRGKFQSNTTNIKNMDSVNIYPSFSIENLSMCSGKMVLKGDPKKGSARWECQK